MELVKRRRNLAPHLALAPGMFIFLTIFVGCTIFSVVLSFTTSRMFPSFDFIGFAQYNALLNNSRWRQAVSNIAFFGPIFICVSVGLGLLLAIFVDQKVRAEGVLRSMYLYPYATSSIVTGLLFRWLFDPNYGIETVMAGLGLPVSGTHLLANKDTVLYTLVVAAVWHAAGLVMVILLAALRGVDEDIWKATRVDGVPKWRTYISVVIPMLTGAFATCIVLLSISVVKVYDLVVAMTKGGPGFASDMPAKFVMDSLFERQNVGLGSAGIVVMLTTVLIVFAPAIFVRSMRVRQRRARL